MSRKPSAEGGDSPDNHICHLNNVIQRVTLTKWEEREERDEMSFFVFVIC